MPTAIPLDKITGAEISIDIEHSEIHDGKYFKAFYESVAPLPTLVGEETAIGFYAPAPATGLKMHLVVDASADDESTFEIREGATLANIGTLLAVFNRDRESATTCLARNHADALGSVSSFTVAQAAAAGLGGGTVLHNERIAIAAGAPFTSILNDRPRGQREWLLDPDIFYVVILTNLTANNTVHKLTLNWYETVDHRYIA